MPIYNIHIVRHVATTFSSLLYFSFFFYLPFSLPIFISNNNSCLFLWISRLIDIFCNLHLYTVFYWYCFILHMILDELTVSLLIFQASSKGESTTFKLMTNLPKLCQTYLSDRITRVPFQWFLSLTMIYFLKKKRPVFR